MFRHLDIAKVQYACRNGDQIFMVIELARQIAADEGIFVGISSGATLAAAFEVADKADEGSVILAMLPDTGERYLSTPLFEGVNEGSDDDWLASLAS